MRHPPESLRSWVQPSEAAALRGCPSLRRQAWSRTPQPPLLRYRLEGGRSQRCEAALARLPLICAAPVACAVGVP